jgi:hypothetical protein
MYVAYHSRGRLSSGFVSSTVPLAFEFVLSECTLMVPGTVDPSED